MSKRVALKMSADEFLEWDLEQPDCRHELEDGVPVAMTGARQVHDQIVVNAMLAIGQQLRGGPCRLFTDGIAVRSPSGNVRRPDLGIHRGPFDDAATYAATPRLVMEVLSPSTREKDQTRKRDEYMSIDSLDNILFVDPEIAEVILWSRDAARAWRHRIIVGLDAVAEMPALGIVVALADLYEGLTLKTVPRLVREGE